MDTQPGQVQTPNDYGHDQLPQPTTNPSYQNPMPPTQTAPSFQVSDGTVQNPTPSQQTAPEPQQPFSPEGSVQSVTSAQDEGWRYDQAADAASVEPLPEDVQWTAAEFVEHPKSTSWYAVLIFAAVALSGIDFFVTKDWFSASIIIVAAIMFGVYAGHKPQTKSYTLSPDGLRIGEKIYAFQTFRAFSTAEEGSTASIMFTPLARFAPPITIYVTRDMEDAVLEYLSLFLPFEQRRADAVDGLLRRIRF
jgi:hypothetical protein